MHLVRDLLDKQLVDVNGRPMGRVDGLMMEAAPGAQPRIATICVGGVVLAGRLPGFVGRWCAAALRRLGPRHGVPFRIPWSRVLDVSAEIGVDVDSDAGDAMASSRWVRDHIIGRIPGA